MDLSNRFRPPEPYCQNRLEVMTNAGKKITLMENLYGRGHPFDIEIPLAVNKKIISGRYSKIIYKVVRDLYERKEINRHDYFNFESKADSPAMQNFRDMYLSFFLLLTEHDDAYYLESYLRWLLHYNRELGGTVKNWAPEVEKMVKEAIRPR